MTRGGFSTLSAINTLFGTLEELNITAAYSVQRYNDNEPFLRQPNLHPALHNHQQNPRQLNPRLSLIPLSRAHLHEILSSLNVPKLDTFYIHGPDPTQAVRRTGITFTLSRSS
ncbi:MAG: hypothetical protein MMC23_002329 [Stictis urceolatum]|nr:hypothetical protein [Stictis urceolata]